jgi:hypothetical protein
MNYLERLQRRRASWQRELDIRGPLAANAPRILALIDSEIATLARAVTDAPGQREDDQLA